MTLPAPPHKRWLLWWPLLGVACWLALFDSPAPQAVVVAAAREPATTATPADQTPAASLGKTAPPRERLAALVPRSQLVPATDAESSTLPARDLFAAHNWTPPPPPIVMQPPAPPSAPALPYQFLGKKQEGHVWEVYLARGEQTFVAREGQSLEGSYRVDQIRPPTMTLTYLPLNEPQSLPIGESR